MSRRTIWLSLAVVAAILVGASVVSNPGPWAARWAAVRSLPWEVWVATAVESSAAFAGRVSIFFDRQPLLAGAIAGGVVVLVLAWFLARRRSSRLPGAAAPADFGALLGRALEPSVVASSRVGEAAALEAAGHSVVEIARQTRLSRDAVRILASRAAGAESPLDRHELPIGSRGAAGTP